MASASENDSFIQALLPRWLLDEAISWIQDNLNPDDVFSDDDLEGWATDNGFVEEE